MRSARLAIAGLALAAAAGGIALLLSTAGRETVLADPSAAARQVHARAQVEPPRSEPRAAPVRLGVLQEPAQTAPGAQRDAASEREEAQEWAVTLLGRVVDESGAPIQGAELATEDGVLRARSDATGWLVTLEERAPWPAHAFVGLALNVCAARHASSTVHVRVRNGATLQLGTLVLAAGADVLGVVRDEAGGPVASANVSLRSLADWPADEAAARTDGIDSRSWLSLETWTDEQGRYRLRGAPEGESFVVASAEGTLHAWTQPFVLRAGQDVTRDLLLPADGTERARWTVRVLDPSGAPVPGASVRERVDTRMRGYGKPVRSFHGQDHHAADDEGRVVLWIPVGEERLVLARDSEERWRASPEERLVAAQDADIELVLREPVQRTIVVADQDGRPIPWSNVHLSSDRWPDGPFDRIRPAGADGKLQLLLPEEPFSIRAYAPGYADASFGPYAPGSLAAQAELVLRLVPGLAVGGRVLADGQPVANAAVSLRFKGEADALWQSSEITAVETSFHATSVAQGGRATTDSAGAFVISVQHDGWYTATVAGSAFPVQTFGPFEVRGAASRGHELVLARGGALEGRVTVPLGESGADRLVGASSGSGLAFTAPVDEDGRYRIENLAPGATSPRAAVRSTRARWCSSGAARRARATRPSSGTTACRRRRRRPFRSRRAWSRCCARENPSARPCASPSLCSRARPASWISRASVSHPPGPPAPLLLHRLA